MSEYRRGDRGPDITRLEIALQEVGLYGGNLDDSFGPKLEAAVRRYQTRRGLPNTGIVDEPIFRAILAEPSPRALAVAGKPPEYRALALTAGFETSAGVPECFAGIAGDFDGQGISFGVLQWNLGQGTLQALLEEMANDHPAVVRRAFGSNHRLLQGILAKPLATQLAWARSIQAANGRSIAEPWRTSFRELGYSAECQEIQLRGARDRFATARRLCDDFGLWSDRALALLFDIVVQNGSIRTGTRQRIRQDFNRIPATASPEEREVAKLRIIANRRAEASRAEFIEDVRARKLAIANGAGVVHGVGYDLERQYLLGLAPMAGEVALPVVNGEL